MNRKKQQISLALVLGTALYCAFPMYASAANSGGHIEEGDVYIGDNGFSDCFIFFSSTCMTLNNILEDHPRYLNLDLHYLAIACACELLSPF